MEVNSSAIWTYLDLISLYVSSGNAVLKGVDLTECATAIERNGQIGGHKSG